MTLKQLIYKTFKLSNNSTNIKTEIFAGCTTFFTMAYIIIVNPIILSAAGMDKGAVFLATCLTVAFSCFLIAFLANYPIALAPSMSLNVYFAYVIVNHLGFSWQEGLGIVFITGILFFIITMTHIRQWIIESIPHSLTTAISAGLGLFIALIALKSSNLITSNSGTIISLANIKTITAIFFMLGFCLIASLNYLKFSGAVLIGIIVITLASYIFGGNHFHGILSLPPAIAPTLGKFQLKSLLHQKAIIVIFTFLLVSLFDSTGTFIGLLKQTKLKIHSRKQFRNALLVDGFASMLGAFLGTSTVGPYVENASGISVGGKTGLTSIIIGLLFLLAIFFAPLAEHIPNYATGPALFFVACLMIRNVTDIDWADTTESIPALITFIMIPFSFSIADGIGLGIISYSLIKILTGKFKDLNVMMLILSIIFIFYFSFKF